MVGPLCPAAPSVKPPNLLFILADQWRASALGVGSDEIVRTPHIDRLASQGVHWQRAYASNPVCTPNRSCILTGRFSHQHGMITNNLMLPPSEVCWPEVYRAAGYATHYIGKWHMDGVEKPGFVPHGWRRRGFDTFEGFNRGHTYHKHWGFDNDGGPIAEKWNANGRVYYEPSLQTDLAIDFMRQYQDQPFCCYVSWGPPHTPFNPPDAWDKYTSSDIRLRPNVPKDHQQRARKDLARYYGLCESLDFEMGRLLEFLDESGLADNTLLVFTADHGELAGSHGKYRKSEPEDESLNVPLIMRMPGRIKSGLQSQTLCNSIDLMPTMLTLCGLTTPEACVGRDLSGAIAGQGIAPDVESVYTEGKVNSGPPQENDSGRRNRRRPETSNAWRSLVTRRYKLTVRGGFDNVERLIDLENDPFEQENLAGDPQRRAVQDDLIGELRRWAQETGDVFPQVPIAAKAMYTDAEADEVHSL